MGPNLAEFAITIAGMEAITFKAIGAAKLDQMVETHNCKAIKGRVAIQPPIILLIVGMRGNGLDICKSCPTLT